MINVPTEAQEQAALFQWAAHAWWKYPTLRLLYHIPNGGSRDPREAHNLRLQGVKSGVPDLCLPVARGGYHGLYIELKRKKGGRLSDQQSDWIDALTKQGYHAVVCKGWEAARQTIVEYLNLRQEREP